MGLREKVISEVDRAFRLIGNLATDVTLVQKTVETFDFATNLTQPNPTPSTTKVVKGVLISKKRKKQDNSNVSHSLKYELLMKAKDVTDISIYDRATINSQTWVFVPPIDNNGYTITLEVVREA